MPDLGFLTPDAIDLALVATDRDGVLRGLADRLCAVHPGLGVDAAALTHALVDREELGSTAIGAGVAVPHCKFRGITEIAGVFGRTTAPIEFGARDRAPVRCFFLVVSPVEASGPHIRVLAAISRLARDAAVRDLLVTSDDVAAVHAALTA